MRLGGDFRGKGSGFLCVAGFHSMQADLILFFTGGVMNVIKVREAVEFKAEKMNKVSLFDTDKFFCDVYCLEPGQFQKVHAHDGSDKVYYVLEGEGTFTVGSGEKVLGADEITMAPAGEEHGVVNHSQDKLVVLVFMAPKP